MTIQEEFQLFNQIQQGDKKALESIFKAYYNMLCNFSHSIVKQPEQVEELVADVFYLLWKEGKNWQIKRSFKAYLFTIVKNKSFEVLRKEGRHFSDIDDEMDPHLWISDITPESQILYEELEMHYQKAYEALPKQCKIIFKLHKIDGLKYHEISEVLGLSVKTVENQMGKALRIIRDRISLYQTEDVT